MKIELKSLPANTIAATDIPPNTNREGIAIIPAVTKSKASIKSPSLRKAVAHGVEQVIPDLTLGMLLVTFLCKHVIFDFTHGDNLNALRQAQSFKGFRIKFSHS